MNLRENMGNVDRIIRAIVAVIFVVALFNGVTSGAFGFLSLAVAQLHFLPPPSSDFAPCTLFSVLIQNGNTAGINGNLFAEFTL